MGTLNITDRSVSTSFNYTDTASDGNKYTITGSMQTDPDEGNIIGLSGSTTITLADGNNTTIQGGYINTGYNAATKELTYSIGGLTLDQQAAVLPVIKDMVAKLEGDAETNKETTE